MKEIKITYGKTGSDETSIYYVTTNEITTVGEFIDEWLATRKNEWGYFGIAKKGEIFGSPCCKYEHGKIKGNSLPKEYLNKKIKNIYGSGGWSRSDFTFEV